MAAIRNGFLVLLICALPTSASAGCGLFSPCGSPSWIGFSLALPIPRLPHLHTFAHHGYQSPMCGAGQYGVGHGCGLGHGRRLGHCGFGRRPNPCPSPCFAPSPCAQPLLSAPPMIAPPLTLPSTTCNPCGPALTTRLVPQQTVSYREVRRTQYRQEAYTASVPVTSYRQVTRFRSVPYQTVARIPQISTRYVPQVTAAAPCNTCLTGLSTPAYGYGNTAALPYSPTPIAMPQTAAVPEYPYPVPQPQRASDTAWQPIPQRQAQQPVPVQQMGYYPASLTQPQRQTPPRSLFRPAPSATTAWQSRWLR